MKNALFFVFYKKSQKTERFNDRGLKMNNQNNYLLLFKINIQETYSMSSWNDMITRVNEEAKKHKPKSTLVSQTQKNHYQNLLNKIKNLEEKQNDCESFTDFIQNQRSEMLAIQVEKTEEIERTLQFCDMEQLNSSDLIKALSAEYAEFQITEDVIVNIIKKALIENNSESESLSDYLSKEDAKILLNALVNAGYENSSLYDVLNEQENSSLNRLQNQAEQYYESARKNNDSALSALFGQCIKIFKTAESKKKYDNYLSITRYEKINRKKYD